MVRNGQSTFRLDKFISGPGQYMQGITDDRTFDEFIVQQMKKYLTLKIEYGENFMPALHAKGFKPISGKKQIEYKIRKRENNMERHGVHKIKDMLKSGKIGFANLYQQKTGVSDV